MPDEPKNSPMDMNITEESENFGVNGQMPPFMMMKMIFKLKEKVAKLEGMVKVMMHTQMGGSMHSGCMCTCCHH